MTKTITLKEIARPAGVSPNTVSRVVNGGKRVSEEKRALVRMADECADVPGMCRAIGMEARGVKITDVRTAEVKAHGYSTYMRAYMDAGLIGNGERIVTGGTFA